MPRNKKYLYFVRTERSQSLLGSTFSRAGGREGGAEGGRREGTGGGSGGRGGLHRDGTGSNFELSIIDLLMLEYTLVVELISFREFFVFV